MCMRCGGWTHAVVMSCAGRACEGKHCTCLAPKFDRLALCMTCESFIRWINCPTGGWWAHEVHPADDHDAIRMPKPPEPHPLGLAAAIDAEVYRQCVQRAETIDKVCEMALAEGCSGVSVYQDVVFVDPEVPYGHIYQHQCAHPV